MRRLAFVFVLAASLAVPARAEAQVLRSFCSSPAMSWCFNATAFDFSSRFSLSLTGYWAGPGFDGVTPGGWFWAIDTGSSVEQRNTRGAPFLPGETTTAYQFGGVGSDPSYTGLTLDDVVEVGWHDRSDPDNLVTSRCGSLPGVAPCFDPRVVPEPSTWLLLGTGLLGLGLVAWRRKEEMLA